MDWDRYKRICDEPHVFSRWMLEQTVELVSPDLAGMLAAAMAGEPVPTPAGHRGAPGTDMFPLTLPAERVAEIVAAVEGALAAGRTTSATRGRGLGGFREAWLEYMRVLKPGGVDVR